MLGWDTEWAVRQRPLWVGHLLTDLPGVQASVARQREAILDSLIIDDCTSQTSPT